MKTIFTNSYFNKTLKSLFAFCVILLMSINVFAQVTATEDFDTETTDSPSFSESGINFTHNFNHLQNLPTYGYGGSAKFLELFSSGSNTVATGVINLNTATNPGIGFKINSFAAYTAGGNSGSPALNGILTISGTPVGGGAVVTASINILSSGAAGGTGVAGQSRDANGIVSGITLAGTPLAGLYFTSLSFQIVDTDIASGTVGTRYLELDHINFTTSVASTNTYAIANASYTEGNSGTTVQAYTITRSVSTAVGSVQIQSSNGTATAGTDYTAVPLTTINFPIGSLTQTVNLTINGDATIEPDETINMTLSNPTGGTISVGTSTVTILTDDNYVETFEDETAALNTFTQGGINFQSTGKLAVFKSSANIGAGGTSAGLLSNPPYATGTQGSIQVTSVGKSISMLSVDLWSSNVVSNTFPPTACTVTFVGTKTDGTGTVTYSQSITPTGTNGYIRVNFAGTPFDNVSILAISFSVSGTANYLNIDNFAFAPISVGTQVSINDVNVLEGTLGGSTTSAVFTVSRTNNTSAFSVDVASSNGTATAGSDYVAFPTTTLNFTNGGALTQTVTVVINKDAVNEPNETFNMTLSNATNGTLYLKQVGIGTISNDDGGIGETFEDETTNATAFTENTVTFSATGGYKVVGSVSNNTGSGSSAYFLSSINNAVGNMGTITMTLPNTAFKINTLDAWVGTASGAFSSGSVTFTGTLFGGGTVTTTKTITATSNSGTGWQQNINFTGTPLDNVSLTALQVSTGGTLKFCDIDNFNYTIVNTAPIIAVVDASNNAITNGGAAGTANNTDFGLRCLTGATQSKTYTIKNTGLTNLTLSGSPLAVLGGTDASQFSITTQPTSPIVPGGSSTFTVLFDPNVGGAKNATITLTNNDGSNSPYVINIIGIGGAEPTITLGVSPAICAGATSFTIPFSGSTASPTSYSVSGTGITTVINGSFVGVSSPFVINLSSPAVFGTNPAYSLTVMNGNGCVSPAYTGSVTVNAGPTLTAGAVTNPITCGGANGSIAFTSTNLPNGTYALSFTPTGAGATTSPQNVTVSGNTFSLSALKAGTYSAFSVTSAGCTGSVATSKVLADPAPTLTAGAVTNPTTCGGANGSIAFTSTNLPNGTYSLSFTPTGAGATTSPQSITVSGNAFSLSSLKAGTYSAFSVTSAGCTGSVATSKLLTDPTAPTLVAGTSTNPTTCGGTGSISFTSTNLPNGTYSLSFTATGAGVTTSPQSITVSGNAFSLSGLKAGTYSDFSVTSGGCVGSVATSKVLADPITTLTAGTSTNPTTCGGTNGSIAFTSTNLPNGTYSLSFTATGTGVTPSPQNVTVSGNAFSLTNLKSGTYSNFSVTVSATGCTGSVATSKVLTDPSPLASSPGNVGINWTGAVSTDWNTACNWNPAWVPDATNSAVVIGLQTNQPTITGTVPTVNQIYINANATLTVNSGGTLNASSTVAVITLQGGNIINDGTINLSGGGSSIGINIGATASITNRGIITTNTPYGVSLSFGNLTFTNESTGVFNGDFKANNNILTLTNRGTINYAGGTFALSLGSAGSSVINDGTISITGGSGISNPSGSTITNNACGKILTNASTYDNAGTTTNAGLIQITNGLTNTGTFTNTGVLKYGSKTGTIINTANSSVIVNNNPTPIFTYGGTFNGTINGIFTDATATTSAGTFTAPNTFTPSGTLPSGSQTLYAKITPSGGACTYIVPFTYNYVAPTITAGAVTNATTCGSATGSIAFTSTNVPNGTYSLSFTTTGTSSPQNVTVSSNAFTLSGLTAGSYNSFSLTGSGITASTGVLSPAKTVANPSAPTLVAGTATNPTICGGTGNIAFTSTNLPNGTYSLSFTATGAGATASPQSITVSGNAFSLAGLKAGTYSAFSVTNIGCTGSVATSKTLTDPAAPTLIAGTATNPTTCGSANGSIAFTSTNLPNGTYSLSFTATGAGATASPQSITVSGNAFSLSGLKSGTYSAFSVTNAGCTGSVATSKVLTDPSAPILVVGTSTNPSTCGGANGNIAFTSTNLPNGTYSLSFTAVGAGATTSPQSITVSGNAFSLNSLKAGTYSAFSVTNIGCTGSVATSKVLTDPSAPIITAGTVVNPTTCGSTGSIPFTSTNLPNGTYSLSFTATGTGATTSPRNVTVSGNAFSLINLSAGSYSNFSLTSTGCTGSDATLKTVTNPPAPTLTAGTSVNPTTCAGTDGSIPFTTNLPDGTYSLSYAGVGSPKSITVSGGAFTLGTLGAGGYSNFSVTNNGCVGTANTPRTLNDPTPPVLTLGASVNPSACNLLDGSIAFSTTNITDGTYSLTYSATGAGATLGPKSVTLSEGNFTLSGLGDGTYSNFSITNIGNCTGSLATPVTLVDLALPVLTVGASSDPTTCSGTNGTIAFTSTNLPDGTYSLSFTTTGTTSPQNITVASNTFTLSGLSAGDYSNFSITRTGCTGSVATLKTLSNPASPSILVGEIVTNPSTCAGTDGEIPFTTINLPNGVYSLSFNTTGTASPKDVTVTNNAFILSGLSAGNYSNFTITNNGCSGNSESSRTLTNPATPTITAGIVTSPSTCSAADGSIAFTSSNLSDGSYTITYTGAGSPKTVTITSNAFTLTGLDDGTYSNFSTTHLGCTASDATPKTVTNPAAPTLTAGATTNPTTCASTDGTIAFTTTLPNGTYTLNYIGSGSPQSITVASGAFILGNLPDGTFSGFSITFAGCVSNAATTKILSDPANPTLTAGTATNPTTCLSTDGSIAFTTSLPNGTYTLNYTGSGSPQSIIVASGAFILGNLPDGTFSGFSVTTGGCTGTSSATKTLTDPAAPTLVAGTANNPTTCLSTDGSIPFTTSLPNGTYTLNYTGSGSPKSITVTSGAFNLTGLPNGTYSGFSVTTGGCTGTSSVTKTLTAPAAPTLTAGLATNPTTCASSDGTIAFTTSLPDGTYTINYTGLGSPQSITVVGGAFILGNLPDGSFSGFSVTTSGCTSLANVTKTLSKPAAPTLTAGAGTNPTTCLSTDGSIAFTTTLPNGTYSINYTGSGSPKNITVASGAFILGNLPDGTFSDFSITTSGCTSLANVTKTLSKPAAPTLIPGLVTNPTTCLSTDGSIAFTTSLPNGTYSLSYIGSGSPQNITVTSGAFVLGNLPDGTFSGFSVTTGGCTGTSAVTKTLTDPANPTLTPGIGTNPTTCLSNDGSIAFTTSLPNGTYLLNYTGSGSPQSITVTSGAFILGNLPDGTFSGFSVTTGGCTGTSSVTKTLSDPAPPTLTAGVGTNPTTCLSTDGSIVFTTTLPNGTYSLNYTGFGSPQNITVVSGAFVLGNLPDGTFSGFSITTGGCTSISNVIKTLSDPAAPTLTAGTVINPTTCSGVEGSIAFTTTLPNGTYTINFTGNGSPKSITVASGAFILTGLSAGTYNGFSITTGGCTSIDNATKTLTDPVAPTITAGAVINPTTCSGTNGSIAFTSTNLPNGTYSMSFTGTGATTSPKNVTVISNSFSLTGLSAGTYSGFSLTNTGCIASDATNKILTDPTAPTATASSNSAICEGNQLNLLGGGVGTYSWTGVNGFSSTDQNPSIPNASILAAGTYKITVTNANGCTATATTSVVINTLPTATARNNSPICSESTLILTGGGVGTYAWAGPSGYASTQQSPSIPSATASMSGTYTITVTNVSGCTSTATTSVTVNPVVNPPIPQANTQIIFGGSVTLTATGCSGINDVLKWYKSFDNLLAVMPASPTATTNYFAQCETTLNGITCISGNSTDVTVTVLQPLPPVASGATICIGGSVTLTATGCSGSTGTFVLKWYQNADDALVTMPVSATTNTDYYAKCEQTFNSVTAVSGKSNVVTVTVLNPLVPVATGGIIYRGNSITLTATGCTGVGFAIKWYQTADNLLVTMPVSPAVTTQYYAKCEQTANSVTCTSVKSNDVTVTVVKRIFVDITKIAAPIQNGNSWATAYGNLQTGLLAAAAVVVSAPAEVWVAQGTYKPTNTTTRTIYFNIPSSVKVYGGFAGTEDALNDRNFRTNTTILSADIGTVNLASDNSYHVVTFEGSSNTTVLDGFTITGGYANFDSKRVVNAPVAAPPTTTTIETGGGIVVQNAGSPMIANCTIVNNAAVTGGGIYVSDASIPKIVACKIMSNQATFGAGVYFQDGSNGSINNTLISGNRGIGAVYNNTSNPTITNCTFAGNGGYNGGIFNSASQPVVKNSIIWNNSTPFNDTQSIITYSTIQGGYAGTGNLNFDPKFVSPVPDGLSPTLNGDYHLQASSLAIDRGDNSGIILTDRDLDGNLRRFNGGTVDMGAYEFQGAATSNIVISAQTGDWEINSTWVGFKVPALGDVVIIDANHIVTINATGIAKSIEYRGTGQIKFKTTAAKLNIGF